MKKFLIKILIVFIIIYITKIISDTYLSGEIGGILIAYLYLFIDEVDKRLKEMNYYKIKEKTKRTKQRLKVFNKIIKLTKKYNLELTRSEFNNEKVLLIRGIMEEN